MTLMNSEAKALVKDLFTSAGQELGLLVSWSHLIDRGFTILQNEHGMDLSALRRLQADALELIAARYGHTADEVGQAMVAMRRAAETAEILAASKDTSDLDGAFRPYASIAKNTVREAIRRAAEQRGDHSSAASNDAR